jgi:hypothetical protein
MSPVSNISTGTEEPTMMETTTQNIIMKFTTKQNNQLYLIEVYSSPTLAEHNIDGLF